MSQPDTRTTLLRSAMTTLGHAMETTMEEDPGVEDHIQVGMTVNSGGRGWRLTLKIEELTVGT